jgi:hypothetical protein
MINLLINSFFFGYITFVIGTIIFNLQINNKNKNTNKPLGIDIAFFTTGVIIYIFCKFKRFNKFICEL